MTLSAWTAAVMEDLRTGGFEVKEYEGFPLAKIPTDKGIEEGVRFLKFKTRYACNRTFYAEGCLFTPAGLRP